MGEEGLISPVVKLPELRLTTHFHPLLGLGISGALFLLPLYAFVACIGTTTPFRLKFT